MAKWWSMWTTLQEAFFFLVLQSSSAPSANTAPFWGHNVIKRWGLASRHSKANKEARLVERKVCFTLDASSQASCPKAKSPHWQHNQWARAFVDRRRELRAEIAQLALTIIMTLVISGLICIILEQTFGLCGRGWGWDVSREQHRNMYII